MVTAGPAETNTVVPAPAVMVTVASSVSVAELPSSSWATTVTMLVRLSPALPVKGAVYEQEYVLAGPRPTGSAVPMAVVQVPWVDRSPCTLSVIATTTTGSRGPVLVTTTL